MSRRRRRSNAPQTPPSKTSTVAGTLYHHGSSGAIYEEDTEAKRAADAEYVAMGLLPAPKPASTATVRPASIADGRAVSLSAAQAQLSGSARQSTTSAMAIPAKSAQAQHPAWSVQAKSVRFAQSPELHIAHQQPHQPKGHGKMPQSASRTQVAPIPAKMAFRAVPQSQINQPAGDGLQKAPSTKRQRATEVTAGTHQDSVRNKVSRQSEDADVPSARQASFADAASASAAPPSLRAPVVPPSSSRHPTAREHGFSTTSNPPKLPKPAASTSKTTPAIVSSAMNNSSLLFRGHASSSSSPHTPQLKIIGRPDMLFRSPPVAAPAPAPAVPAASFSPGKLSPRQRKNQRKHRQHPAEAVHNNAIIISPSPVVRAHALAPAQTSPHLSPRQRKNLRKHRRHEAEAARAAEARSPFRPRMAATINLVHSPPIGSIGSIGSASSSSSSFSASSPFNASGGTQTSTLSPRQRKNIRKQQRQHEVASIVLSPASPSVTTTLPAIRSIAPPVRQNLAAFSASSGAGPSSAAGHSRASGVLATLASVDACSKLLRLNDTSHLVSVHQEKANGVASKRRHAEESDSDDDIEITSVTVARKPPDQRAPEPLIKLRSSIPAHALRRSMPLVPTCSKRKLTPLTFNASLSPSHDGKLASILSMQPTALISSVHGIKVLGSDLQHLRPARWLNDEVINLYGTLIAARSAGCSTLPSVLFFNTFFFSKLQKHGYEGVRRWTKDTDIFSFDQVLIPVNSNNLHWTLLVIDMRRKHVGYFDSMHGQGSSHLKVGVFV
ncbi:hypothetical protein, variant [Capsaspora owczarzaki ATCC 30864]|uniref:Ubiquitin-like protease family profile domain-containing protein n=1 Tax=Capsaspora owczarzaki (strain ATCC 30864) TaxID=595528 RepID=A0A0D2WIU7_CAPO3|nr:hypothetical protein, variant [Capsaspora owczarzaki ATCC 30864]